MAMGSGMRPDVWREFLRRFGDIKVVETYGMTEGNVTLFNYTGRVGAVGRASWIYKVGITTFVEVYSFAFPGQVQETKQGNKCVKLSTVS